MVEMHKINDKRRNINHKDTSLSSFQERGMLNPGEGQALRTKKYVITTSSNAIWSRNPMRAPHIP